MSKNMKWNDFLLELCNKYDIEKSQKEYLRVVQHNNENTIDVKDETMKLVDVFGDTTEIDLKTFVTVQTSQDDFPGKKYQNWNKSWFHEKKFS